MQPCFVSPLSGPKIWPLCSRAPISPDAKTTVFVLLVATFFSFTGSWPNVLITCFSFSSSPLPPPFLKLEPRSWVAQGVLEPLIFLSSYCKYWIYRHVPLCSAYTVLSRYSAHWATSPPKFLQPCFQDGLCETIMSFFPNTDFHLNSVNSGLSPSISRSCNLFSALYILLALCWRPWSSAICNHCVHESLCSLSPAWLPLSLCSLGIHCSEQSQPMTW